MTDVGVMENPSKTSARVVSPRLAIVLVFMLLAVAMGSYYCLWRQARIEAWEVGAQELPYKSQRDQFLGHLRNGRYDLGYAMTSNRFQNEWGEMQFAELAKKYVALEQQPEDRYVGNSVGQSGGAGRGGSPSAIEHQRMEFHRQFRYADGKMITITLGVGREADSLFQLSPPELRVVTFKIEEGMGPVGSGPK